MNKIGFVILNYKNYQETIRCVDSILLQKHVELKIVIVDNGSGNESVEVLNERYADYNTVYVMESEKNLGFARGNNLGIKYLKEVGYDFIWVANSDTVFTDEYISKDCLDAYKENVGLINATSYKADGSDNFKTCYGKKYLYLRLLKRFAVVWISSALKIGKKLKESTTTDKQNKEFDYYALNKKKTGKSIIHDDKYVVTGSVFLLTKDFLKCFDGLFPETFFYGEEYATILFLHKTGLKTQTVDTGVILHKHMASTPSKFTKNYWVESNRKVSKLIFMSAKRIVQKY